eukprot:3268686-Alexandrium_andersonii.AAC.1
MVAGGRGGMAAPRASPVMHCCRPPRSDPGRGRPWSGRPAHYSAAGRLAAALLHLRRRAGRVRLADAWRGRPRHSL